MSLNVTSYSQSLTTDSTLPSPGFSEPGVDGEGSGSENTWADLTGIVGQSSALRNVLQLIDMVATSNATVLLLGETGTGKELIAKAIHERSTRRNEGFVTLNCAAIPSALLRVNFSVMNAERLPAPTCKKSDG